MSGGTFPPDTRPVGKGVSIGACTERLGAFERRDDYLPSRHARSRIMTRGLRRSERENTAMRESAARSRSFTTFFQALMALLTHFPLVLKRNDIWHVTSLLSDFTPLKSSPHEHDLSSYSYYF